MHEIYKVAKDFSWKAEFLENVTECLLEFRNQWLYAKDGQSLRIVALKGRVAKKSLFFPISNSDQDGSDRCMKSALHRNQGHYQGSKQMRGSKQNI